jgi:hypothetical protein
MKISTEPAQRVLCRNEDHGRPTTAVASLSWPDGRYRPTTACVGDLAWHVRYSLDEDHPVLVEPASGETAATKAMNDLDEAHAAQAGA